MGYRIKTLEQMTGLSRNTITAWERRYDLLDPVKDASGYRSYSDADVELLLRVRGLLDGGLQIGEVVDQIRAERNRRAPEVPPPLPSDRWRALLEHLLAFDSDGADEITSRFTELSFRRRVDEIFLPLLREVGELWAGGRCTIAQEHFTSTYVRDALVAILHAVEDGPRDGPRVVCAGYPGELHELGLLAVAIHLALRGNRVVYLGANLPIEELAETLRSKPADLVCVSVMTPIPEDLLWRTAVALRQDVDPRTGVVFGGPATAALVTREAEGLAFCPRWEDLVARLERRARG
ncbi:MAG: cobalamin B12-binding domain-containing protein [Myxococcota bacterium]